MSLRAWGVWAVGLSAYIVGVLHRTSLGVAGLDAQHRFGVGAGALASFAVLQLLVYAGLQVPAGVLLDRFGSLRLVVAGALIMAGGQTLMAMTHSVSGAVIARVLVGAGDAMTFISVLRLVPQWFPAFLGTAGLGLFVAIVALVALRDTPQRRINTGPAVTFAQLRADLTGAWRHPGTRLGLTATGIVNVGGFVASLLTLLLIGVILDARTGGSASYDIGDFKVALSVQYLVIAVGLVGILRTRRLARRRLAEQGVVVRPIREILAERRGFSPPGVGKGNGLEREPASVSRGGHD